MNRNSLSRGELVRNAVAIHGARHVAVIEDEVFRERVDQEETDRAHGNIRRCKIQKLRAT